MELKIHPLCLIFPRMERSDFEELKTDIKANGLRQRIVFYKGMILDGGNRYRACLEVGVRPGTMDCNGDDPVAFVISQNMRRRHLSAGQKAVIVAAAADWSRCTSAAGMVPTSIRAKVQPLHHCSTQQHQFYLCKPLPTVRQSRGQVLGRRRTPTR